MRRPALGRLAMLAVVVLWTACAPRRAENAPRPHPNRSVLTHEELLDRNFLNAYEAVEALRSNWLQTRGTDSFRTPSVVLVYMDNIRLGGVEALRGIAT